MATRGTIYYAFTKSRESSVFSSETQLTWRLSISQPSSQEWWKVQSARIRITISSGTPLSWLSADFLLQKIGMTLSLIRNTNQSQWCDYCKTRYGQLKDGTWHHRAQVPAVWKVVSETPTRRGITRFYCQECANEAQKWPDGTFWTLKEQLDYAIANFATQEKLNVELP